MDPTAPAGTAASDPTASMSTKVGPSPRQVSRINRNMQDARRLLRKRSGATAR
jgi:hypothetical protein